MQQGRRITVERGGFSHGFVLVWPPFPEKGDLVNWEGQEWTVTSSLPTAIVMSCPRSIKVNVEIPGESPHAP